MSEDNKQDEIKRGVRGELGLGSPGSRLKTLWHKKKCPGSLKAFIRSLTDNPDVAEWQANKQGLNNQSPLDTTVKRARESAVATRSSKRKKSEKGGK